MSGKPHNVLVLHGDSSSAVEAMFAQHGYNVLNGPQDLSRADLVVFTGGTDVNPKVYGEEPHPKTQWPDDQRDHDEILIYKYCTSFESKLVPMVGICRGGQLLNVLNDGKMIQHLGKTVSGDVEMWDNEIDDTRIVRVDHHQGMHSADTGNEAPGWHSLDDTWVDYVIWYPETKSLCFQPHPEWGHQGTEDYFFSLIERYIQ